jgi:hypothetical protein
VDNGIHSGERPSYRREIPDIGTLARRRPEAVEIGELIPVRESATDDAADDPARSGDQDATQLTHLGDFSTAGSTAVLGR